MNKKGYSIFTIFLFFTVLVIGYVVSQQVDFDINRFKDSIEWTPVSFDTTEQPEIGNALEYYINGLGAASFEIIKWVAQFAYENPDIPWKLIIILFCLAIIAPIALFLFKIIIIIFILIKEYFQSRKEKRRFGRVKARGHEQRFYKKRSSRLP